MKSKKEIDVSELENEGLPKRELHGAAGRIMYLVGLAMTLFHIYTLAIRPSSPWLLYCGHMAFGFTLCFATYCMTRKSSRSKIPLYDWVFMGAIILCAIYTVVESPKLVYRTGVSPTQLDLVVSAVVILLVLEVTRRTCGNILPTIAVIFLLYARFGSYVPGILGHKGYSWSKILSYMLSLDAVFSTPMSASASMVFLFIVFGAFLQRSGAGDFFMDVALGAAGRFRGGPAKVAVISSALFGTVSGNSVANVVSTGAMTIPMMKNTGYSPAFAAAVEATASTGGQIMPPILGSAAFIMASMIGVPYMRIVMASIIPALLYFFTVFMMVDLEAVKLNLRGMREGEYPGLKHTLLSRGYMLLPLAALIFTLSVLNMSPIRAALLGIGACVVVSLPRKEHRMGLRAILDAMSQGAFNSVNVISACGTAGIVIGVLNLTGTGLKFASAIVSLSFGKLPLALLLTMLTSIVLGMGLPTTASYLICAAVTAPALTQMGLTPLAAHMFIFYFACISAITPPVAMAAYAGAGIAKAKPMAVAFLACKLGISAFLAPYAFAYSAVLLWEGAPLEILWAACTALAGLSFLSFGAQGRFFRTPVPTAGRALLIAASICLITPETFSDYIGIAAGTAVIVLSILRARSGQKAAPKQEPSDKTENEGG